MNREHCIICEGSFATLRRSDEHVIPYALGGNLVIDSVCKPCNDRLGAVVDAPLVENSLMRFLRSTLHIRTRGGEIPSFVMTLKERPSVTFDYRPGVDGLPPEIRVHRRVVWETRPDGQQWILVSPANMAEATEIARKMRGRRGVEVERIEEREDVLAAATPVSTTTVHGQEVIPAIVKIVYELAHYWLGSSYVDDPTRNSLRRWLMDYLDGSVSREPVAWPEEVLHSKFFDTDSVFPPYLSDRVEHVAVMIYDSGVMACHLRLFNVVEAVVKVTDYPRRYGDGVGWNDAFVFDPIARSVTRCERTEVWTLFETAAPRFTLERSMEGGRDVLRVLEGGKERARMTGDPAD